MFINKTIRLHRASGSALNDRVDKITNLAKARAARENSPLAALVVHEDYDAVEDNSRLLAKRRVESALVRVVDPAVYALAVEETEAWLLLFPEALERHVSGWRVPPALHGRNTGLVSDPKGEIKRRVSTNARR